MADRGDNTIKLQVANARSGDAGRGIARIPLKTLAELGIGEGTPIAIEGERLTTAVAMGPYSEDEGLDVIRLDGLLRGSALRQENTRDDLQAASPALKPLHMLDYLSEIHQPMECIGARFLK